MAFALCHHVIPRAVYRIRTERAGGTASVTPAPLPTATPATPTPTAAPEEAEEEPDTRTEWQIRFEDRFTDTVVVTENSYSSPNVSITIETVSIDDHGWPQVWYVADIYIGEIDCFATYLAGGEYSVVATETVESMSLKVPALIAINGDFYNMHRNTTIVRNGVWYMDQVSAQDICVLYRDGTVENLLRGNYDAERLKERDVWQSWCFGPSLLDENGQVPESFNMSPIVANAYHPRCGLGYYEPGHYCFVLLDGRHGSWSRGMPISDFAQIFADLGCTSAYNLDGGGSAAMTFMGGLYNHLSDGAREIADILYIREPPEEGASSEGGEA